MIRDLKMVGLALMGAALVAVAGPTPAAAASFRHDWNLAMKAPVPTNSILGPWEGVWKSQGHHVSGPLRCIIRETSSGRYEAYFHAQFHWFHFSYVAKLDAEKSDTAMKLQGDADLGWLGGVYHYAGEASCQAYVSSYKSPVEFGVLELKRPNKRL